MQERQTISSEAVRKVRGLLEQEGTPFARACLGMLDKGEDINAAADAAGTDMFSLMRQWHAFADANGIVAEDGSRACIHVLSAAYDADHGENDLQSGAARDD